MVGLKAMEMVPLQGQEDFTVMIVVGLSVKEIGERLKCMADLRNVDGKRMSNDYCDKRVVS
jgi:hypothetical protein